MTEIVIHYPSRLSEAEIQAMLWQELNKQSDIEARLQVKAQRNGRRSRLDVVVFTKQIPFCIIECKSWSDSYIRNQRYRKGHNTKQITKYKEDYKMPVFLCGCVQSIPKLVIIVTELQKRFTAKWT